MNPYEMLAEPVRDWINARGWTSFSAIQTEAIPRICDGQSVLLVSPTASGKTEAAVLPIISEIIAQRLQPIALLYIAPLKALINDQAGRIERILDETSLQSAWWHGDTSQGQRAKILKQPPHALLTTPESLEVMLSSDAYGHGALLHAVRYVLVDEVHAFAESERGAQLTSLIARMEARGVTPFVRIALSATVGEPNRIATWLQSKLLPSTRPITIMPAGSGRRRIGVGLIPQVTDDGLTAHERHQSSNMRLARILTTHVVGRRSLVFANARATAEEVTTLLRDRGVDTHIHHGSVDVEVRRRTEALFREDGPKTIVATSTLELGIDIGDLEQTIQLGPPASASAFLQRLGRSGRRGDQESMGYIYALHADDLPVTLAVADLAHQGISEVLYPDDCAFSVLFQQILQTTRELEGPSADDIFAVLSPAGAFAALERGVFDDVVQDLVDGSYLEDARGRLYIGSEAERRFSAFNYRDFYSVFLTDRSWIIKHGTETIGTIDRTYPLAADGRSVFILAGRKWLVESVDRDRLIALVVPAPTAKVPRWSGDPMPYSFEVMRRTSELLCGSISSLEHPALASAMNAARVQARRIGIVPNAIVIEARENDTVAHTYAGFAVNDYLRRLLSATLGVKTFCTGYLVGVRSGGGVSIAKLASNIEALLDPAASARTIAEGAAVAAALDDIVPGKFAPYFGERTRRHEAIHRLRRGRMQLARYDVRTVHVSNTTNAIAT